jgi:exodeoxyribonuclease V
VNDVSGLDAHQAGFERTTLSAEQRAAFGRIAAFLADPAPRDPYLAVQGLAGTGKTHLLGAVARAYPRARPVAFTGKAASVLERKVGVHASTVHSAIYRFEGEDEERGDLRFSQKIGQNEWSRGVVTLLLDESSMIDERIAADLLATGARVVAFGDPGQLPPIKGEPFFGRADVTLTEIHRQALGSPIVRQAHRVRALGDYDPAGDGEAFRVAPRLSEDLLVGADALLCWTNKTRRETNDLARFARGLVGAPRAGEPVMCLRNNKRFGVLNGAVYTLLRDYDPELPVKVRNDLGRDVAVPRSWLEDHGEDPGGDERGRDWPTPFALAYAATVHKYQGSEAGHVVVIDEFPRFKTERRPWLYTAITRARERVTVVNPTASWGRF